jgi:hypothetical protein
VFSINKLELIQPGVDAAPALARSLARSAVSLPWHRLLNAPRQ